MTEAGTRPTVGSLFTGAAGMTRGFERAGFEAAWHAEIDKDAAAVLRRHYGATPNLGDVRGVHGGRVEPVDVIEGGSPCQDVSQAGSRAGLNGARSGLFFEYVRIIGEMREATNGRYPAVAVLENVDGLLSSNRGRDFAVVLARLQELGAAVAYRVLDAQFFGVPQRRRRVFCVADFVPLGVGEERAAQVLALREGLCRHPEAGTEARQGAAAAPETSAGVGGFDQVARTTRGAASADRLPALCDGALGHVGCVPQVPQATDGRFAFDAWSGTANGHVVSTIMASAGHHGWSPNGGPLIAEPLAFGGNNCSGPIDVATACLADGWHGDFDTQTFIVAPWDEAQVTSAVNRSRVDPDAACPTLHRGGTVSIVAAEVASAIQASAGHHGHSSPRGDGSDNLVALTFNWQAGATVNLSVSERADGTLSTSQTPAVMLAFQDSQSDTRIGDTLGTLDSNYGARRRRGVFERYGLRWIVRRLTPTEGEALMGWERDWTRWRDDGRQISDSARWRLIGNGVVTPVAYWLADRIRAALEAGA